MLFNLIKLFTLAGIAYAGYAVMIYATQRQIIYAGTNIRVEGGAPAGIVPIQVVTASGSGEAWFMPPTSLKQGERRGVVIFFHGNGEVIDSLPKQVEGFREMGLGVLLVEYPGFGRSEGKPDETSISATAVAAYDAVLKREEVDPERIVIFGRSLGSGPACSLAARRPSAALILQSAFTSTKPFARRFFAPEFLVRDRFDNAAVVAAYKQPILLFHGSHDTVVPPEHSRQLQRLAAKARLVEFPCGHNDLPPDPGEFYRIIAAFLKEVGVIPKS